MHFFARVKCTTCVALAEKNGKQFMRYDFCVAVYFRSAER